MTCPAVIAEETLDILVQYVHKSPRVEMILEKFLMKGFSKNFGLQLVDKVCVSQRNVSEITNEVIFNKEALVLQ